MRAAAALILALAVVSAARAVGPTDWPQFRGHSAAGNADQFTLPLTWSATQNVAWASPIPGRGWSSPIVWGNRVYVTSAVNAGGFKEPSTGIFGNDYVAELMAQGLPPAEVNKRVTARDIELTSEIEDVRWVSFDDLHQEVYEDPARYAPWLAGVLSVWFQSHDG